MQHKLDKNRDKGDDWTDMEMGYLLGRLEEEVKEIKDAFVKNKSVREDIAFDVACECADVANFAMMIADKLGELDGIVLGHIETSYDACVSLYGQYELYCDWFNSPRKVYETDESDPMGFIEWLSWQKKQVAKQKV